MKGLSKINWGAQTGSLVAAVFFLAPLVLVVATSFQGQGALVNYTTVLTNPLLPRFFINSAIVSVATTTIVIVVTTMAGFALSKLRLNLSNTIMNVILVGLMIPTAVMVVPLFIQARQFGLFNNYLGLIGPFVALTVPFSLLMVRNFMDSVGDEILEAGRLDGCGDLRLLFLVLIPVIKPIIVVVGLWAFMGAWNEYFLASIFMQVPELQMVTQAPGFYIGQYQRDTGKVFASLVIISLPLLVIYLFGQKAIIDGLGAGSVK